MSDFDDDLLLHDDEPGTDEESPALEVGAVDDHDQPAGDEPHPVDSPFERMAAAAERRAADDRLVMEVPGWDGELLIEFKLLARREAKRLRSATRSARDDMAKVVADLLVTASPGLMYYDDDGNPVPLLHNGRRVSFVDVGLFMRSMQGRITSDRQGFLALFMQGAAMELNEISLQMFADRVGRWMANTSIRPEGAVSLSDGDEEIVPGS